MKLLTLPATLLLSGLCLTAPTAHSQVVVYSNQENYTGTVLGAFANSLEWDDLLIDGGGTLSSISFATMHSTFGNPNVSGLIDLRLFDEGSNAPQGQSLGLFPFDGVFPKDPTDPLNQRVLIEFSGLESENITLPDNTRLGAAIKFDQSNWRLLAATPPIVGSSPGGNWIGSSSTENNEAGGDFAWAVSVVDPNPPGPGIGTYNLFETAEATPDHPNSNSGTSVDENFYSAVNFTIRRRTDLKQVGAFLNGSGSVFAAVVETTGLFAAPTPPDLTGTNVLGHTLLDLPPGFDGQDVVGDLDLTLEPGTYALVVGSGRFGATGSATLRNGHVPNGDWTGYTLRQSDGLQTLVAGAQRLFAVAQSAPDTVQVRPTYDILAEIDNDGLGDRPDIRLIDGEDSLFVDTDTSGGDPDQAAVLEFSLANVPTDRLILSATLELDLNLLTSSGPLMVDVEGFAGDGTPQRSDAYGPKEVIGTTSFETGGFDDATVELDPTFVQSLIGSASHLGLTFRPNDDGNFRFGSLEGGQFLEAALLTLEFAPPINLTLPGDFNGDGIVDAVDYAVWRENLGAGTEDALNDAGDGQNGVDAADYAIWRANYGATLPVPGPSATFAPEPSSVAMMLLSLTLGFSSRRKS